MGQVSLPVLSRKGKYDNWNYSWVAFKNYSSAFNEDLFLKRFFFLFFMYGISDKKYFLRIFFKKNSLKFKSKQPTHFNLIEHDVETLYKTIKTTQPNKFYVTQIFLCRYINWIYIYIYIYSISNRKLKALHKQKRVKFINKYFYGRLYLISKQKYLTHK